MKELRLLSEVSLSFQNLNDFDQEMDKVLKNIGSVIDVSRIYILFNITKETLNNTFEWCNEGVHPHIDDLQNLNSKDLPSWIEIIKDQGHICANDIMDLPQDMIDMLEPQGIKSILVYPLTINNETIGYIGFDECRYKRKWESQELEILNTISGIISNAYERKFFQESIIDSETNFRNFFETIDDVFIVSDLNGKMMHCNKALIDKLEYSLEELKDMNIIELHPKEHREKSNTIVEKMLKCEIDHCSLEIESKKGKIFSVETRLWIGKWNKQDSIFSISKDITDKVKLTTKLQENYQKLTNIIEGTNLGTWEFNVQTRDLVINEQSARTIGYTLEELEPINADTWNTHIHPEDLKISNEIIDRHLNGEIDYYNYELRMKHKDGRWIWVQDVGRIIERDLDGIPLKIFGTHSNISERKQAEENLKESEKRFMLALNETKAGLWDYDMINNKLFLSPMWKKILGYEDDEIENTFDNWISFWNEDDKEDIKKIIDDFRNGKTKKFETIQRLKHKDGKWRWIKTRGGILKDRKGISYRWIGTIRDVTLEHEQALELERFFAVNLDLLCISDVTGNLIKINKTWEDVLGYSSEEISIRNILDFVHEDDIPNTLEVMEKLNKDEKVINFINRFITADGSYRYIEWKSYPFEGIIYSAARDITDRIEYEDQILEVSNRDSLTNVYNRRYIFDKSKGLVKGYKLKGTIFSVSIIDIDFFKKINDTHGHQIGDCVLKEFTKIIGENLRSLDILGRYGGEEFIVIFSNTNKESSHLVIDRTLNIIRNKVFVFDGKEIKLTFSAGIASCEEIGKEDITIDKLVDIADKRMYTAKDKGRNQIVCD